MRSERRDHNDREAIAATSQLPERQLSGTATKTRKVLIHGFQHCTLSWRSAEPALTAEHCLADEHDAGPPLVRQEGELCTRQPGQLLHVFIAAGARQRPELAHRLDVE